MKPYLVDSHCHLHDKTCFPKKTGEDSPEAIIKQSIDNNVKQFVVIGTSHHDSLDAQKFAMEHDNVYYTYGIHPEYATTDEERSINPISAKATAAMEKLVAIGEVGLDYHYGNENREAQIALLEEMLFLAKSHDLPLVFHVREAFDDFLPIVENQHVTEAVIHSFSDSRQNLEKVLNRGYYVGVNGLATFADIPLPPLERMLLETDAPYLTPVPFRGKINKSAYIKNIAEFLSTKLGVPLEQIAAETTKNVQTLFHIPDSILRA